MAELWMPGAEKQAQLKQEKELTARLLIKQGGLCSECKCALGWGSAKHEIKHRSQGGSPTDETNCKLLCLKCHGKAHGLDIMIGG